MSNNPFSRKRVLDDVLAALPAIGMIVGAVAGVGLGVLNPQEVGRRVRGGRIGAGLVIGILLRVMLRRD